MSTHIVVLDGYTTDQRDDAWRELRRYGTADVYDHTQPEDVVDRARGADVVLTNKVPIDASALEALQPDLSFVSMLATGYDPVDVEAARRQGIPVSNVPEYATDSVAEHAFALLLELTHRVGHHEREVRRGEWSKRPDFTFWTRPLTELSGKTIGVVGFGRIGGRIAEIARGFEMPVLASERTSRSAPDWEEFEWRTTPEVFEEADVVSLSCPLTEDNEELVDADMLERMQSSALLVNTARGDLVDERALLEALETGEIAGAGLDVVAEEPIDPDHPLLEADNCVITPHNAWTTREARARLKQTTLENIEAFLEGEPIHVVNGVEQV